MNACSPTSGSPPTSGSANAKSVAMLKRIIDELPRPVDAIQSYANFLKVYRHFTPEEWNDCDMFFDVLNHIARRRPELVDLGTRMNVQVNLYQRTIAEYGSDHVDTAATDDAIGCFALTESRAGVLSGLVVDVQFAETDLGYVLNSGDVCKRWISQGIMATQSLVIASNVSNHRDCRIFRVGTTELGVERCRMVDDTHNVPIMDVLDLAEFRYTDVRLPRSAVLEKTIRMTRKEILGGIFQGRLCLAEVVMNSITAFVEFVWKRVCDVDKFRQLGHVRFLTETLDGLERYCSEMANRRRTILEQRDVLTINCYKIHCIERSIALYNKIHMMFGTYALGFGVTYQTLIINKVAEGDTSVLKLACIRQHLENVSNRAGSVDAGGVTAGIVAIVASGIGWRHWWGLIRDPKQYVQTYRDMLFDDIVGRIIPTLPAF